MLGCPSPIAAAAITRPPRALPRTSLPLAAHPHPGTPPPRGTPPAPGRAPRPRGGRAGAAALCYPPGFPAWGAPAPASHRRPPGGGQGEPQGTSPKLRPPLKPRDPRGKRGSGAAPRRRAVLGRHVAAPYKIQIAMKCKFQPRNLSRAILFPEISLPLISLLGEIPPGFRALVSLFFFFFLFAVVVQPTSVGFPSAALPAGPRPSLPGAAPAPALPLGAGRFSPGAFGDRA